MVTSKQKFGIYCSIPGFVVLIGVILFPTIYNLVTSFTRYDNFSPVVFNGLRNYRALFRSRDFYTSWRVSLVYSLGVTTISVVMGIILATCLSKIKKGSAVFRTIVILPWAAPLVVSGLMWKWILSNNLGIVNYLLSLIGIGPVDFLVNPNLEILSGIIGTSWAYIPFATILILASMESIPLELFEASKIDGADSIQAFWSITLGLIKKQILVAGLIVWMFTFRTPDMFVALTRGGPGKATYHAGIFLQDTIYKYLDFGRGAAIGVLIFLTLAIPSSIILYKGVLKE